MDNNQSNYHIFEKTLDASSVFITVINQTTNELVYDRYQFGGNYLYIDGNRLFLRNVSKVFKDKKFIGIHGLDQIIQYVKLVNIRNVMQIKLQLQFPTILLNLLKEKEHYNDQSNFLVIILYITEITICN